MMQFSKKFIKKFRFILFAAIRIFCYALVTVFMMWPLALGLETVKPLQIIVFCAVFCALLMAHEIQKWFPSKSDFMKVPREFVIFLCCEITACILVITDLDNLFKNEKRYFIRMNSLRIYFAIFWTILPVMNGLIHSILIYHSIRGTEKTTFKCMALIRAFYIILGFIFLYGTMWFLLLPNISNVYGGVICVQIVLLSSTMMQVCLLRIGCESKAIKKIPDSDKWAFFLLIPMLPFIVIGLTKSTQNTLSSNQASNSTWKIDFTTVRPDYSSSAFIYWFFVFWRLFYLKHKIDPIFTKELSIPRSKDCNDEHEKSIGDMTAINIPLAK